MSVGDEVELWAIWSQDTFGFADDRDPPQLESLHADKAEAELRLAVLRQAESDNKFLRLWLAKQTLEEL